MVANIVIRPMEDSSNEFLVFGMTWEPVIGSRPERESIERVKGWKATHYIPAGDHSTMVGLVKLPAEKKRKKKEKRSLYSPAIIFAESHPVGAHGLTVDLQDGSTWVIASHDGVVISGTDVVCETRDDAALVIASLKDRYPEVKMGVSKALSPPSSKHTNTALLREVKTSLESIPPWMRYAFIVLFALIAYDKGTDLWRKHAAAQDQALNVEQYVDTSAEWKKALDIWQKGIRVDGPVGLTALFENLLETPIQVEGWGLRSIECIPSTKGWSCTGNYDRLVLGTNISLFVGAPKGWRVNWQSLDKASLSWDIGAPLTILNRLNIGSNENTNIQYLSQLQNVYPAFKQMQVGVRTVAPVPAPTVTNSQGEHRAVPTPEKIEPSTHVPGVRKLLFVGPLRSLSVLPITETTSIKYILVKITDYIDPTINNSMLSAELSGEMYVQ